MKIVCTWCEEEGKPAELFAAPKSERLRQFLSSHLQV